MVINWTNPAIEDLKEFHDITKILNPEIYISQLVKYVNSLLDNPEMGKPFRYINYFLVRELIFEKHRIFYYINDDTIHIISVIHHRQDINQKLKVIKRRFNF